MTPRETKSLYEDQPLSAQRPSPIGLRFAKRIKPIAAKTRYSTKARHGQRNSKQNRLGVS